MATRRRGHQRSYTPAYRAPAQKSARQIGKEIREHTGMTTEEYKRYYNRIRNQVRNFEKDLQTSGAPINVAQFIYDIDRRQLRAERQNRQVELTAEQRAILGYTSVSTAAPQSGARAVRAIDLVIGQNGAFRPLIEKSLYVSEKFNDWVIKRIEETGEQPTAAEINRELSRLADEIHTLRKSAAGQGASFYNKYGRRSRS